jgi:hypothetical protein
MWEVNPKYKRLRVAFRVRLQRSKGDRNSVIETAPRDVNISIRSCDYSSRLVVVPTREEARSADKCSELKLPVQGSKGGKDRIVVRRKLAIERSRMWWANLSIHFCLPQIRTFAFPLTRLTVHHRRCRRTALTRLVKMHLRQTSCR